MTTPKKHEPYDFTADEQRFIALIRASNVCDIADKPKPSKSVIDWKWLTGMVLAVTGWLAVSVTANYKENLVKIEQGQIQLQQAQIRTEALLLSVQKDMKNFVTREEVLVIIRNEEDRANAQKDRLLREGH